MAFQQLKGMPHLNHVTCIAHGLHHICESIRENYISVNDFIAVPKKILVKAPSRQVLYQEVTGLHFPHFHALDSTDAAAIKHVQQLVSNKGLEFSAWFVLYCIEGVITAAQCTATFSDL